MIVPTELIWGMSAEEYYKAQDDIDNTWFNVILYCAERQLIVKTQAEHIRHMQELNWMGQDKSNYKLIYLHSDFSKIKEFVEYNEVNLDLYGFVIDMNGKNIYP